MAADLAVDAPVAGQSGASKGKKEKEVAQQAFDTDYGNALERWRDIKVTATAGSSTRVTDVPLEPHPDDAGLIEHTYVRTGGEPPPPAPAFDPSLSQPPMPTNWPGADTAQPTEPADSGLPAPDPEKPTAKIYELPRDRGNRDRT